VPQRTHRPCSATSATVLGGAVFFT
jgi:hypothetical protein